MKVYGELETAQLEAISADPANTPRGRFYLNTTSGVLKLYDGTAWRTVVTTDNTQTLTNKTLTSPTITGATVTTSTITVRDNVFTLQDESDNTKQLRFQIGGLTTGTTRTLAVPDKDDTLLTRTSSDTGSSRVTTKDLDDANVLFVNNSDLTKKLAFSAGNITTGTTRTLSAPDATGTIVLEGATQTLTNKTITVSDSAFTLQDDGDATKQLRFQLSGISAGQTRVVAVPDFNTDIVGTTATQNIQNKTLDNTNTITLKDDSFTLQDEGDTTKQLRFQLSGITSGQTRTLTVPDVSDTIVSLTATQTLTNKTLTTPTIDDYVDINEESAPSSPSSGKLRLFAKSDKKLYTKNSDGTETAVGSGAGEKNYIQGSSTAAGWTAVGDLTLATTTTAASLPREYTTGSGISITATAATTQSTADYVYYDFTLDDVDLSKKLKIQWAQKTTGTYAAGDLAVVITTQADRTTALHTPITTAIPASDGVFTTSFDASTTATLSLVIRATTDMADSGGIVISDVVVGPGIQPQGAVVTGAQTYTMTVGATTTPPTKGTASPDKATWWREGEYMVVHYTYRQTAAGSAGSGTYLFPIPSGHTIDTTKTDANAAGSAGVGWATAWDGTNTQTGNVFAHSTTNLFLAVGHATQNPLDVGSGNVSLGNTNARISFEARVPIAEWAGSGTVNVAQNDVEYAWNSSTSTSDDTSSFGYGPTGSLVHAFAPTGTNVITKRVRFQTPIQATDDIDLELDLNGGGVWGPVRSRNWKFNDAGTTTYGIGWARASSTEIDVFFASGPWPGRTWSDDNSIGVRWRVKKAAGGQAVGFGEVAQSSSGLVKSAGQLKGTNTNDSALTGYVGEHIDESRVRSASTSLTTATTVDITATALTLTAGDWDIQGSVGYTMSAATVTALRWGISTVSATLPASTDTVGVPNSSGEYRASQGIVGWTTTSGEWVGVIPTYRVSLAASDTLYLVGDATFSAGSVSIYGHISARRVR